MDKVILIAGTERSGSTLLDRMLGNAPNGFSIGEVYALFRPYCKHHILSKNYMYSNDSCQFWHDIKRGGEKNVYTTIFNKKKETEFIVDSSKDPIWIKNQLKYSRNKDYKIIPIMIFKTPLEFAYSKYKRNQLNGWKNAWTKTHLRLFKVLDDFRTVKYIDLAKNPSEKLRSICNYIGIDYFEGKEQFWNNEPTYFLFGSGTLRRSKKLVYYDSQYEGKKMRHIKNKINFKDKNLENILTVLEGYEINPENKIDESIIKLKDKIKNLSFFYLSQRILLHTPYYPINRIGYNFQKIFKRFT